MVKLREKIQFSRNNVSFTYDLSVNLFTTDYIWSDGSASDFFFWDDEEPNSDEERCVEMLSPSRKWNDNDCGKYNQYVCKANKGGIFFTHQSKNFLNDNKYS